MMKRSIVKLLFICLFLILINHQLIAQDCCAFEAYAINNANNTLVGVDPITGNQTPITTLSQNLGFNTLGAEIIDCLYYVYSFENNSFYTINLSTGQVVNTGIVFNCGSSIGIVTSLEVDPTTGTLYIATCSGVSSTLAQIDLATGTCTIVAPILDMNGSLLTCISGFVINEIGQAYMVDNNTDCLVPIDLTTGQATGPSIPLVDPLGNGVDIGLTQGLDLDCPYGGNQLLGYIVDNTTNNTLYVSINPVNGVVTTITNLGLYNFVYSPNFTFCTLPVLPCEAEAGTLNGN